MTIKFIGPKDKTINILLVCGPGEDKRAEIKDEFNLNNTLQEITKYEGNDNHCGKSKCQGW